MSNKLKTFREFVLQSSTFEKSLAVSTIIIIPVIINKVIKFFRNKKKRLEYKKKAEEALKKRNKKLEDFINKYQHLDHFDKEIILNSDITTLLKLLKERKITSQQILITYALNTCTIGKELNLLADVNLENAMDLAILADEYYRKQTTNILPPLLGIPISIKDHIHVKGMLSTLGYISNSTNIIREDSLIVQILREKGAIPFIKSNVPQGLMSFETSNNLWGDALNPLNKTKTCGGSSGGESGLIVSKCSPIGIGTDFAGSIRVPCSFTGIYGFKPTSSRVSTLGHINLASGDYTGFNVFNPSWGPMARSVDDIVLIMRSLFGEFKDDPYINNAIFDEELYNEDINFTTGKLKIGYLLDYGSCETAEEIKDGIISICNSLRKKGFKTEALGIDKSLIDNVLNMAGCLLGNSEEIRQVIKGLNGEDHCRFYNDWVFLLNSSWIERKIKSMYYKIRGDYRLSAMIGGSRLISREEYIETIRKFTQSKYAFYKALCEMNYDAIIMPVTPFPAFDIGMSTTANHFNQFCLLTNVLDMPSACIPTGKFKNLTYHTKHNDSLADGVKSIIKGAENLPFGIQIVTKPKEDELCLKLMKFIDTLNNAQ